MSIRESDLRKNKGALPFSLRKDLRAGRAPLVENWSTEAQQISRDYCGIQQELRWRQRPEIDQGDRARILVTRWKRLSPHVQEHESRGDPDFAIVTITLQPTELELVLDGECVHDGSCGPGMVFATPAACLAKVKFRSACDCLHLYIPTVRLRGIADEVAHTSATNYFRHSRLWTADPAIERLAWLLLKAGDFDVESGALYLDGIAQAILARLLDARAASEQEGRGNRRLPKWRMKRVLQLIEADLSRPLRLAELAECAGLSRMHFAAQFRQSTGLQPHEFLVHRRIQRAQEILRESELPLAEVALVVGFQTQAHFTTVFRRLSGDTPGRWRQLQRLDDASVRSRICSHRLP